MRALTSPAEKAAFNVARSKGIWPQALSYSASLCQQLLEGIVRSPQMHRLCQPATQPASQPPLRGPV